MDVEPLLFLTVLGGVSSMLGRLVFRSLRLAADGT
jgi:hypothetical protein